MTTLDKQDLIKALEIIVQKLEKKGVLKGLSPKEKNEVINGIVASLQKTFPHGVPQAELRNPAMQKMLIFSLTAAFVMKTSEHYGKELTPEQLKQTLKPLILALNKLEPDPKKRLLEKEIDEALDAFAQKLTTQPENTPTPNLAADSAAATLRGIFGGIDPRFTGGIAIPLATMVGNYMGFVDIGGGESAYAVIDEYSRVDLNRPDYTGSESITKQHKISSGAMSEELETEFENEGLLPSSNNTHRSTWPPRLTPPGMGEH